MQQWKHHIKLAIMINSLETVEVTSSDIGLVWGIRPDERKNVMNLRVHHQQMGSQVINYSPMLPANERAYRITDLESDEDYRVCVMAYRNASYPGQSSFRPTSECIDVSTSTWHMPVSIGSTVGALVALSVIISIVLLAKCRGKKKRSSRRNSSIRYFSTSHYSSSMDPNMELSDLQPVSEVDESSITHSFTDSRVVYMHDYKNGYHSIPTNEEQTRDKSPSTSHKQDIEIRIYPSEDPSRDTTAGYMYCVNNDLENSQHNKKGKNGGKNGGKKSTTKSDSGNREGDSSHMTQGYDEARRMSDTFKAQCDVHSKFSQDHLNEIDSGQNGPSESLVIEPDDSVQTPVLTSDNAHENDGKLRAEGAVVDNNNQRMIDGNRKQVCAAQINLNSVRDERDNGQSISLKSEYEENTSHGQTDGITHTPSYGDVNKPLTDKKCACYENGSQHYEVNECNSLVTLKQNKLLDMLPESAV